MKLICFPHYTAGGLLCDILENKFSTVGAHGGIDSGSHALAKLGDSESIFDKFDAEQFNLRLLEYQHSEKVVGSHCWPGGLDLSTADQVILITTETSRSKIYRWLRAWHLLFSKTDAVKCLAGQDLIDKQRELAKNYIAPFRAIPDATNVEFADIVETTNEFYKVTKDLVTEHHMQRWQQINYFLYDTNLWSNELVKRYYEAEFEITHGRSYQYN